MESTRKFMLALAYLLLIAGALFTIIKMPNSDKPADGIQYCENVQVGDEENLVIKKIIKSFANKVNCNISKNCLTKWDIKGNTAKYSVAWQEQCGPVVNGVHQLGDNGMGSTFVCETKHNSSCCWPLGYDHVEEFVMCLKWDNNK
jgi:hypothetical protein